jgi:hypothetical protein
MAPGSEVEWRAGSEGKLSGMAVGGSVLLGAD